MEIAGYLASLLIGITLGLIGGGGSIVTVPVLVYLFRLQPVTATAYSLFIVGSTSLVGSYPKLKSGEINIRTALFFGIPSIISVFFTRAFLVPAIPETIFTIGGFRLSKSVMMMIVFAVLMIAASTSLIRSARNEKPVLRGQRAHHLLIISEGVGVGLLTGLVGAGGGFLIVPALILLSKLPVKQAVGTSLLIIAANSLIGFIADPGKSALDWSLMLGITALAVTGIFIGNKLGRHITPTQLKKAFGWFVLLLGVLILIKELLF